MCRHGQRGDGDVPIGIGYLVFIQHDIFAQLGKQQRVFAFHFHCFAHRFGRADLFFAAKEIYHYITRSRLALIIHRYAVFAFARCNFVIRAAVALGKRCFHAVYFQFDGAVSPYLHQHPSVVRHSDFPRPIHAQVLGIYVVISVCIRKNNFIHLAAVIAFFGGVGFVIRHAEWLDSQRGGFSGTIGAGGQKQAAH